MQLLTDYGNSLNNELTKQMESYQSIGLLMGMTGLILGILGSAVIGSLGLWVAVVSFIGIVVPLVNTKHHKNVGIVLIVLGILGNLLLLIPGIMALGTNQNRNRRLNQRVRRRGLE